jgi:hypothetical protein
METQKLIHYLRSTFALSFGRRLALASAWMIKLVDYQNHDGMGVSPGFCFFCKHLQGSTRKAEGPCPEKEATTLDQVRLIIERVL